MPRVTPSFKGNTCITKLSRNRVGSPYNLPLFTLFLVRQAQADNVDINHPAYVTPRGQV